MSTLNLVFLLVTLLTTTRLNAAQNHKPPSLVSNIFGKGFSLLVGQKYERQENEPEAFKDYALKDVSNDEIARMTAQQIVERSGFLSETHNVTSDDGYITQLVRIVNPRADQSQLKQPPVLMLQGGISDQCIWVWASAIQHHPEKYPRLAEDGPITSWNRSLGFVLANNGYDVWLVGTRGSNEGNRGHMRLKHHENWMEGPAPYGGDSQAGHNEVIDVGEQANKHRDIFERMRYWDFSMDELANYELPRQIDTVLSLTGAQKITLVPLSISTMISNILLVSKPDYKAKLHNAVLFAPIANNKGTNNVLGGFHRTICTHLPWELGNFLYTELFFSRFTREALLHIGKRKELRYLLIKALVVAYAGPSSKYQTLLEPAVYNKILLPTGFKEIKHYCQQVIANQLQHYDYGPVRNKLIYGSITPTKYNMRESDWGNWMVVSGANDKFATARSVQQYIRNSRTPPKQHLVVKKYNHLDLVAGFDVDVKVNLPVLAYLDQNYIRPSRHAAFQ